MHLKVTRLLALASTLWVWAISVSAQIPIDCPPNNWIVRETDAQLMERVIAISTFPEVLDQRLWNGKEMKPEVRTKTLQIVDNLIRGMRLSTNSNDGLSTHNISLGSAELFGSNASYEYDDAADYGRRNSKRGVTERGAGKGSGNSKGCYPCSSRTENEGSRWIWPGRPPSLPFLGVRVFVPSLGRGQGSTRRRTASISLICRSTSRRRANGFCAALSALNRALVSGPTSAQAITRSSGVCVGP